MAALECNSTPTSFNNAAATQENGETLPEEKSLSIDYSEDLWLANSEDSSGPYAQQSTSNKTPAIQESGQTSYPNSVSSHTGESTTGNTFPIPQHHWGEIPVQSEEDGATVLQPSTTTFLNGTVQHNGMEFHNSSGDEKDFAQLVPAGTYVETAGGDAQNKTFTALMPAAGLDVNGEGFTTMLNAAGQQQMVFYGSGEDVVNADSTSHMMTQQTIAYNQPANQMTTVDSQNQSPTSGEDGTGEGNLYVAMDATDNQTVGVGVLGDQGDDSMKNDGQGYATSTVSGNQQAISTLPFIQNGASFPAPPHSSFSSFGQAGVVVSGNSVQITDASQSNDGIQGVGVEDGGEFANHTSTQEDYDQDDENSNSREAAEMSAYPYQDQSGMEDGQGENSTQLKTFICETCQKSFATARYLKYHRKNHCKRAGSYEGRSEQEEMMGLEVKRFACNICQRPFRVLKCMKVHKKKKHGIMKDFTCPNCAISFNTSQELTEHACQPKSPLPNQDQAIVIPVGSLHPPPPSSSSTPFLSQKKKKKLRQIKPSCDICGKVFGDRISLDIHRVKHIEEEFYPCDMCPLDLHAEDSTHLAVHFRIKFFTDDNQHILEDQKAAAEAMRTDETLHSPLSSSQMSANTPSTTPNASLIISPSSHLVSSSTPMYSNPSSIIATAAACTHIITHGQEDGDATTFIDESGTEYSTIKTEDGGLAHFPTNSDTSEMVVTPNDITQQEGTRTFFTEYSGGGSSSGGGDISQVKSTSGSADDGIPVTKTILRSKPHMCDICNKSFTEASKLDIHYKSNHVEDRPFQCEICDKSFFTKWKLQRHMLSHLEQKPHSCPSCSKSFVERGKLEAHYRTHLGTKPYKCEFCNKAFTVKSQLTIHVRRIHSEDQPFGCEVCGKAFLWRSGLEKHMRKHTREKPYSCSFCVQKYSQKSNLISHLAKVHNHQYIEPDQQQQQQQLQEMQEEQQSVE